MLNKGFLVVSANAALDIYNSTLLVDGGQPNVINSTGLAGNLNIFNSILYNLRASGSSVGGATSLDNIQYNLLGDGLYNGQYGNFKADPLFVVGDSLLHVQPNSPTLNKGNPSDDYSNEPLPNGNRLDLGAYGNTSETPISP